MRTHTGIFGGLLFAAVAAVAAVASTLPESAGYGPHPQLPPAQPQKIPTIKIAPMRPWTGAATPQAAAGFAVNEFARNLAHPRMLYTLPNGDVLVAETDTPEKPEDYKGVKGTVMKFEQRRAGAGHGSANRLTCCAMPTRAVSPRRRRFSCRA